MSQHADLSTHAVATAAEPSYAERARTLVHVARAGALSTLSRRLPGHPFGSVMPYAPDARGRPARPHQRHGHAHAEPRGGSPREPAW